MDLVEPSNPSLDCRDVEVARRDRYPLRFQTPVIVYATSVPSVRLWCTYSASTRLSRPLKRTEV